MPSENYTLRSSMLSWRQALNGLSYLLPNGIDVDNLAQLPIFAVILVIDNDTVNSHATNPKHSPDMLMQAWAKDHPNWQVIAIPSDTQSHTITAKKESSPIYNASVFRYLLIDKISSDKKDAAIHVIDDQITSFLKKKLKPKPDYNYQVDKTGQIANFEFDVPATRHYLDCHILSVAQLIKKHKLVCFDMDSTLIKQEVIVELAKMAGVGDEVDAITEQAMRGEIDFNTSFVRRVALLQGTPISTIDDIKSLLIPQSGAFLTIRALKQLGYKTALISGGFMPFAKFIADLLGIDMYYANQLDVVNDKLTGDINGTIIDGNQKAKIVTRLAQKMNITPDDVVCVGDGANDIPMLTLANLGIAYKAKPIVQARADVAINLTGLEGVLYALGYDVQTTQQTA